MLQTRRAAVEGANGDEAVSDTGATRSLLVLVALLTVVTLELLRASGPLLDVAVDRSMNAAFMTVAVAYLVVPFLFRQVLVRLTPRVEPPIELLSGVVLLVFARLVVQGLSGDARFVLGLATMSLALTVLTFAVSAIVGSPTGSSAAVAVAAGATIGMGIQLGLGTWDAYWRDGWLGWGVTMLLLACVLTAGLRAHRRGAVPRSMHASGASALGLTMGLSVMMFANAAFASSQSEVRLVVAGPVAATSLLAAGLLVSFVQRPGSRLTRAGLTLVLALAVTGMMWTGGAIVLVSLVIAQSATFALFASAVEPRKVGKRAVAATARATPAGWVSRRRGKHRSPAVLPAGL